MATPLFLPREFWLLKIDSICKSDNVLHSHENTPSICHKTENPVQIKLFYPFNCLSISSQQIFCWDPLSTASRHSRSDSEMNVHQWQWVYSTNEKEEFLQWDGIAPFPCMYDGHAASFKSHTSQWKCGSPWAHHWKCRHCNVPLV